MLFLLKKIVDRWEMMGIMAGIKQGWINFVRLSYYVCLYQLRIMYIVNACVCLYIFNSIIVQFSKPAFHLN